MRTDDGFRWALLTLALSPLLVPAVAAASPAGTDDTWRVTVGPSAVSAPSTLSPLSTPTTLHIPPSPAASGHAQLPVLSWLPGRVRRGFRRRPPPPRVRPYRERDYRRGDRGYDRRYGPRHVYEREFREGFRAGYHRGYRIVVTATGARDEEGATTGRGPGSRAVDGAQSLAVALRLSLLTKNGERMRRARRCGVGQPASAEGGERAGETRAG